MAMQHRLSPTSPDAGWLRDRLRASGHSQSDLARALGKHRSAVSNMLSGKRRLLRADEIQIVAKLIKAPIEDVVKWAGKEGLAGAHREPGASKQAEFKQPANSENSEQDAKKPRHHPAWGALKGMITLLPDVDYTEPADPEWGKVYED